MLAQLLSSKPKSRLVNLFLAHPLRSFSLTELKESTGCSQKMLVQTIRELSKMGFLTVHFKEKNRYYQIDRHFALYPELVNLIRKVKRLPYDLLQKAAIKAGGSRFVALTGVFAGKPRIEPDVLFVGRISPMRLKRFLKVAEKFAERQISYTIFTASEFEYRKIMNDRFVKNVLENDPVVVIDHLRHKTPSRFPKR
jgi:DNA-binding MarR family transcriptional regulator